MCIADNLRLIKQRIAASELAQGRPPGSVNMLAVSKNRSAEEMRDAYIAGQTCFGENYVQEALPKQVALADCEITWHFIGAIQSNKTKPIAEHFAWVHSVDRLKIAERLNAQRPPHLSSLNICIEVNIDQELTKSGARIDDLSSLAQAVSKLDRLRLRGLMVIPKASDDPEAQCRCFQRLADIQSDLKSEGLELDTLSMGMSGDFEAAIAAGSTYVRIGAALFDH